MLWAFDLWWQLQWWSQFICLIILFDRQTEEGVLFCIWSVVLNKIICLLIYNLLLFRIWDFNFILIFFFLAFKSIIGIDMETWNFWIWIETINLIRFYTIIKFKLLSMNNYYFIFFCLKKNVRPSHVLFRFDYLQST